MRRKAWMPTFVLSLVALSATIYLVHYLVFADAEHLLKYGLHELAFVPIEVLLVSLVLHRFLERREKRERLEKLNMVIGTFFVEMGSDALSHIAAFDTDEPPLPERHSPRAGWTEKEYAAAIDAVRHVPDGVDARHGDLVALHDYLRGNRDFMMRMLENPNLFEHDEFTDLLWALVHLSEELSRRPSLVDLPESDLLHLSGDIRRAYGLLLARWLHYLEDLRTRYPYLYSLAIRTNPFDPNASPIVE